MSIEFSFIFWSKCLFSPKSLTIKSLKHVVGKNLSPHCRNALIGANLPLQIGAERTICNGIAYGYGSFTGRVDQESLQYPMTIGGPGARDSVGAPAKSD
jgi:hypothetical protein